jgi:methylase of polypeptide subunit release factors
MVDSYRDVTAAVRKGGTVASDSGAIAPENPIWVEFARSMSGLAGIQAQLIANLVGASSGGPWKVLDIAAGHGQYGIAIAKVNPRAEILAQDWAGVLTVAEENARAAGVAGSRL